MSRDISNSRLGQRLLLGKVLISEAASVALEAAGVEGVGLLSRHLHGDWGDISSADVLQNELAVLLGLRVQSRYEISESKATWISTEADRATTSMVLVESVWENHRGG